MRHLERQGRPEPTERPDHYSPLGCQYINLTGDYLWIKSSAKPRQLRSLPSVLSSPLTEAA